MASTNDFKQRLLDEIDQNQERLTKLLAFLKTPVFLNLEEEDQNLLVKQSKLMSDLDFILKERARRLGV